MTSLGKPIKSDSPQGRKIHDFLVREAGVPAASTHVTVTYGVGELIQITAVMHGRTPPGHDAAGDATTTEPTP